MQYSEIAIDPVLTAKSHGRGRQAVRLSAAIGANLSVRGDGGFLEISYRDLAAAAWGVYKNERFFAEKHGVKTDYRDDINGGGYQRLEIGRNQLFDEEDCIIRVIFSTGESDDWIYEADLKMDGRKDYDPGRNLGKHKFGAQSVEIFIAKPDDLLEWLNKSYLVWVSELSRLSKPHTTLLEWARSELDMSVRCKQRSCDNEVKILPNRELQKYLNTCKTIDDLRGRLTCSKCGTKKPDVMPF